MASPLTAGFKTFYQKQMGAITGPTHCKKTEIKASVNVLVFVKLGFLVLMQATVK